MKHNGKILLFSILIFIAISFVAKGFSFQPYVKTLPYEGPQCFFINNTDKNITISCTPTELIFEFKQGVKLVSIFDITGRELYRNTNIESGTLTISKEKLPSIPAIYLIRIEEKNGSIKSFKIRL